MSLLGNFLVLRRESWEKYQSFCSKFWDRPCRNEERKKEREKGRGGKKERKKARKKARKKERKKERKKGVSSRPRCG